MPRSARQHSSTGIYHITLRGIDRRDLFLEDEDFEYFTHALQRLQKERGVRFFACCLLDNHVHLLLRESPEGISKDMNRLCSSYAARYSKKYKTYGYVFQDRFHSSSVESAEYFTVCLLYIINNPVKAGICISPAKYPWLWVSRSVWSVQRGQLCVPLAEAQDTQNSPLVPLYRESVVVQRRPSDEEIGAILCGSGSCEDVSSIAGLYEREKVIAVKAAIDAGATLRQIAKLTVMSKSAIGRLAKKKV